MNARLDDRPTATTFDVESLVTRVWTGQIRVPHFQRDFRWSREDVRRLFDSIVKGYPVGSLLLWEREAPEQRLHLGALHIEALEMANARWVVDGQQRITSLANALHESGQSDPRFALSYDVVKRDFTASTAGGEATLIPLPVIFDLHKILKWFAEHPEISEHLDHTTAITKRIRQFPIPAYEVKQDNPEVLQIIFDRMNNYGKRLSRAEVFSALYAGDESKQADTLTIGRVAEHVNSERQFGVIDDDTLLRAILARRGPDVTRDIHHEFDDSHRKTNEFPGEDRDSAYRRSEESLLRAVEFLQDELGVPHIALLPYRFLLVVLTRLFAHHPEIDDRNRVLLRRWFWRVAVVGPYIFRGSATGAMKALTYRISPNSLSDSIQGLLSVVERSEYGSPDITRFRTNEGAGKIIMCSWWSMRPRDLITGEVLEQNKLAEALGEKTTAAPVIPFIVSPRAVPEPLKQSAANRIMLASESLPLNELDSLLSRDPVDMDEDAWRAVLHSHSLTPEVASLVARGEIEGFLVERQTLIQDNLNQFLEAMCEWSFEDTPPLGDLIIDDEDAEEIIDAVD
ncbi:DUF262 domain-containing protein [Streptomyces aureus]|uniref:DUF262 domain-containing protein n=1 Tax=Streptomyces aureus TaxID=193461 RepID=UPI003404E0D1